jgi:hypothetical protein
MIDEKTFYAAYGDVFVYLCATALLILVILSMQRRKEYAGRNTGKTDRSSKEN